MYEHPRAGQYTVLSRQDIAGAGTCGKEVYGSPRYGNIRTNGAVTKNGLRQMDSTTKDMTWDHRIQDCDETAP